MLAVTAGCGAKPTPSPADNYPSVYSICEIWFSLRADINSSYDQTDNGLVSSTEPRSGVASMMRGSPLEARVDDFRHTLNRFMNSPVGSLYRVQRKQEIRSLDDTDSALERLKAAIQQGDKEEIFSAVRKIDTAVLILQGIDTNLAEVSQMNFFLLFFFFSLLIITIILIFRILHNRLEKAVNRERQSLAFSRETVLAQEQERSRIARELHDTVTQDLWRLSFQTDGINKTADSAERSRLCAEVVRGQQELMQRVRNICNNLIPPDFQRRHLGDALRNLCYNFQKRTGIECQVTIQDGIDFSLLDGGTQLQCYRIVQECFANIEKHSGAAQASVLVHSNKKGELAICVSDDGKGYFPPDGDSNSQQKRLHELRADGHYGLWSLYERAASMNATLVIDSGDGEGTTITLRITENSL
jgi:signal transduction histidine kinase